MGFLRDLKNKIKGAFLKKINRAVGRSVPNMTSQIRNATKEFWKRSDTYNSLIGGTLNHEFGFPLGTATALVDDFLEDASQAIDINFIPFADTPGTEFSGGLDIYVLKENMSEILASPSAFFITGKGFDIEWANWLLVKGNKIVIDSYVFKPGSEEYSRSGFGIMVKSKNRSWRVPPSHSGVPGNNWLTRALENDVLSVRNQYKVIIETELKRAIT